MTLIKKTIILTNQETQGYCTVVRVGEEIGAKIVGANFSPDMRAGIKIGSQPTYISALQGTKTEVTLPLSFAQNDNIGCLVMLNDSVFAKGGIYVSSHEMVINSQESPPNDDIITPPKEVIATPIANLEVFSEPSELRAAAILEEDNDILKRLGGENENFYSSAKDKLNELFIIYPPDKNLEQIIPDSKWVKISYDGEDYYVVGQLFSEGKLNHIGYGVPGIKAIQPPKITDGYADWLPVNNIKPYDGYWLIFQNAETGKMSNL